MIKYYRNPNTKMIHAFDAEREPKHYGYTNCGNLAITMLKPMEQSEVRAAANHEFCIKCRQIFVHEHELAQ